MSLSFFMRRDCLSAALLSIVAALASPSEELLAQPEIVPSKSVFRENEELIVRVGGLGKIGVESSLSGTSFEHDLNDTNEISVGPITGAGFHSVRFISPDGSQATVLSLLVSSLESGQFSIQGHVGTAIKNGDTALTAETLKKFQQGATKERLGKALTTAITPWLVENAANLSGSLTVCAVCLIPNPASSVACPVCAESVSCNGIDLGLEVSKALARIQIDEGVLEKEEGERLIRAIERGQTIGGIVNAGDKLGRTLEISAVAADAVFENDAIKATVSNAIDEAGTVRIWIDIVKKAP